MAAKLCRSGEYLTLANDSDCVKRPVGPTSQFRVVPCVCTVDSALTYTNGTPNGHIALSCNDVHYPFLHIHINYNYFHIQYDYI